MSENDDLKFYWRGEIRTDLISFLNECVENNVISKEEMNDEMNAFETICDLALGKRHDK